MADRDPIVLAWDIDNTLSTSTAWNAEQIMSAEPRQEILDLMELAHHKFFNVIHTARRHDLYIPTIAWLAKVNAGYQAISMGKLAADCYIDDKGFNPDCPECLDRLNKIIKG